MLIQKTVRIFISFFWVVYFLILVVFVAGSFLANPELTLFSRFKTFITQSGSMVPTIKVGDLIFDDVTVERPPQSGEIITFHDVDNHVVTHRVVEISAHDGQVYFTTKGDNNNAVDPDKITQKNIIGFYKARLPYLGYLVIYLRRPAGLALLILTPIILTILGELFKVEKKSKVDKAEVVFEKTSNTDATKSSATVSDQTNQTETSSSPVKVLEKDQPETAKVIDKTELKIKHLNNQKSITRKTAENKKEISEENGVRVVIESL